MFYWIYSLPSLVVIAILGIVFVGIFWLGSLVARSYVHEIHGHTPLNDVLGSFLHYFGVIYGLLLGLLAIVTYQNYTDAEKAVASEASSLAALYRDVSAYPEPPRAALQTMLRDYTRSVIDNDWPLQQKGVVPTRAVAQIGAFEDQLVRFEPQTKSQELLHAQALQQFNAFYGYRRSRLYSVTSGIPAVLWYTIMLGAFINIVLIWLFDLRRGAHWLLGSLVSFYLATLISVIALMDHPFRGELSVSPDAFRLVYDQLMKP